MKSKMHHSNIYIKVMLQKEESKTLKKVKSFDGLSNLIRWTKETGHTRHEAQLSF